MKIKKIIPILTATILSLCLGIIAFSDITENVPGENHYALVSNGIMVMQDEESGVSSTIDAHDFYKLANAIDSTKSDIQKEIEERRESEEALKEEINNDIKDALNEEIEKRKESGEQIKAQAVKAEYIPATETTPATVIFTTGLIVDDESEPDPSSGE